MWSGYLKRLARLNVAVGQIGEYALHGRDLSVPTRYSMNPSARRTLLSMSHSLRYDRTIPSQLLITIPQS